MNGVKETAESIKRKLSMDDYPEVRIGKKPKISSGKKVKLTIYLPEELDKQLMKFVYKQKMEGAKIDRSSVMAEALQNLLETEDANQV